VSQSWSNGDGLPKNDATVRLEFVLPHDMLCLFQGCFFLGQESFRCRFVFDLTLWCVV